jgi:hypothetical protein
MTKPEMNGDEILEPISLSGSSDSKRMSSSQSGAWWLLLLLAIWTFGVYGFFNRGTNEVVESPPPVREEPEHVEAVTEEAEPEPVAQIPLPATVNKQLDRVRLVSDPDAANVLLDGVFMGMTPLEMERPRGGQQLSFRKSGYETIQVAEALWRDESELVVELAPILGQVRILVSPPHATLWMNGTELDLPEDGVVQLPLRRQRIKATAPGYQDLELEVLPAFAYERQIHFQLQTSEAEMAE